MLIGKPPAYPSSAITPKDRYLNRRKVHERCCGTWCCYALAAARIVDLVSPRTRAFADAKLETVKSPLSPRASS